MGFRGEALASIGPSRRPAFSAVRKTPMPRTKSSTAAADFDPQAAAGNVGTTIEVRNLFFNTPARRKFIKGSGTEYGYIAEWCMALCLFAISAESIHHRAVPFL